MPQISESKFSEDWDFPRKLRKNWLYLQDIEHDQNKSKARFTIGVKKDKFKVIGLKE